MDTMQGWAERHDHYERHGGRKVDKHDSDDHHPLEHETPSPRAILAGLTPEHDHLDPVLLEALHGDHDDLSASNTYARVIRADEAPEFSYFANPPISPTESIIEVGILNKGGELTTSYYSAYTGARILALNLKTPDADTEDHDESFVKPITFTPILKSNQHLHPLRDGSRKKEPLRGKRLLKAVQQERHLANTTNPTHIANEILAPISGTRRRLKHLLNQS